MVLEQAGVPQSLQLLIRVMHTESITSVEHAPAAREQFAMMRRLSSELLPVYDGFDRVVRWLMTNVLPPEPHRPRSLQRTACAFTDDFALAIGSCANPCRSLLMLLLLLTTSQG